MIILADFVNQFREGSSAGHNRFSSNDRDFTIMSSSPVEDTGDDFDLNNSAEEMLAKLMNQTFSVNICGRKVQFDVRDEIFMLCAPVGPRGKPLIND